MKNLIFIALIAFGINAKAQITLEHDYDSASTIYHGSPYVADQLMIINFEVSGERYVNINREGKYISIYDMNHSLLKTINCSGFPLQYGIYMGQVIYLSEQLFNMDAKIEFLYGYVDQSTTPNTYYTGIYNEDGVLLFSDTGAPIVNVNTPQQQFPIYNTSVGTKMILSYDNGHAKVFSLPGTLTTGIQKGNAQLVQAQGGQFSNLFPNPNSGTVTLQYELPKGETEGEIILYNQQGTEVKRYKVDGAFKNIIIDNTQLSQGTYIYQLVTSKGAVGVKKMVVMK